MKSSLTQAVCVGYSLGKCPEESKAACMKGGREMLHKVRQQTGTAGRTASNMTHISVQRRHLNEPAHTLPEKHEGAQAGQELSIVGGLEGDRRISLQHARCQRASRRAFASDVPFDAIFTVRLTNFQRARPGTEAFKDKCNLQF